MSSEHKRLILLALGLTLLVAIGFAIRRSPARADDHMMPQHPPEHLLLHEQFYSKWKRHEDGGSCCNKRDCYPTKAVFDESLGLWRARRREDGKMLVIPKSVYDPDNPDEAISPDGQSHLCAPAPGNVRWDEYMTPNPVTHYLGHYLKRPKEKDRIFCFTPGEGH